MSVFQGGEGGVEVVGHDEDGEPGQAGGAAPISARRAPVGCDYRSMSALLRREIGGHVEEPGGCEIARATSVNAASIPWAAALDLEARLLT